MGALRDAAGIRRGERAWGRWLLKSKVLEALGPVIFGLVVRGPHHL